MKFHIVTFPRNYAAFSGWVITVVIGMSAILMQASRNGNDLWLSYWVDTTASHQKEYSTSFYLVIIAFPEIHATVSFPLYLILFRNWNKAHKSRIHINLLLRHSICFHRVNAGYTGHVLYHKFLSYLGEGILICIWRLKSCS